MPAMDLNTLFQSDPAAQELGLGFLGQEKQMNQATLAQKLFETERQKQLLPLDIQQRQLANKATEAQIPGMQADSEKRQIDTRFARDTIVPKIQAEMSSLKGKISEAELKEITNAGQAYLQAGPLLDKMPGVVSHAAARQILGNFYRPEFDQVPPEALGQVISYFGEGMVAGQAKYVQQLGLLDRKLGSAERVAETKSAAQIEAARISAAARTRQFNQDVMEAQAALKAKFGNYPQQAAYYKDKARQVAQEAAFTGDEQDKRRLLQMANIYGDMAEEAMHQERLKAIAAQQEANRSKPDVSAFDIPTVTPPAMPPGGPRPSGSGNNPTVAPSGQTPMGSPETFKKAFGAYEPDKYEYRIGPNGQPQRRKKQ